MNRYGWFINQKADLLGTALKSNADAWTVIDAATYLSTLRAIRAARPAARILVRYYQKPTPLDAVPEDNAAHYFYNRYYYHREFTNMVMPLNEPQIEALYYEPGNAESMAALWERLNVWLCRWITAFRKLAPDAFIVFPSPAPAVAWDESPIASLDGITLCNEAISQCDAIGQNCYWNADGGGLMLNGLWYAFRYRLTWERTQKPIWISECNGNVNSALWLSQMCYYFSAVAKDPYVLGATCFLLQAHDGQFRDHDVSRRSDVEGDMTTIRSYLEGATADMEQQLLGTERVLREVAWNALGVPYNPEAAIAKMAQALNLGVPETVEFDFVSGGITYRGQGFAKGILYCVKDRWDRVYGPIPW